MANDAHDNAITDAQAYEKYAKRPQSEDKLAELSQLAEEQLAKQQAVADAERALKERKEELRQIAEVAVPELMDSLGIENFTTTSGIKIKVGTKIRASINAQNQRGAFDWLREHGHEAIIKRELKMTFGMGEDEQAQEVIKKLDGMPVQDKSAVHPSTLVKFVGEMLEAGHDVPAELFNIHQQRITKIDVKK